MWLLATIALAAEPPALTVESAVLPWAEVGYSSAGTGRTAFGADGLTGGPDGLAAVYDPVGQRVIVISDLSVVGRVELPRVVSVAFTADGDLLALQDEKLALLDQRGTVFDQVPLPDLAGPQSVVRVEGDAVWVSDLFGQWHRVARINLRDLAAADTSVRPKAALDVAVEPATSTVVVDGAPYKIPKVRTAEARALEGSGRRWIVLDAVIAEGAPARRTAWIDGRSAPVRTEGRPYVPNQDLAVDYDGRLLVIVPQPDGLHVSRISP